MIVVNKRWYWILTWGPTPDEMCDIDDLDAVRGHLHDADVRIRMIHEFDDDEYEKLGMRLELEANETPSSDG